MAPKTQNEKLRDYQRKLINPYRRINAELLDESKALFRYTCRTCGHAWKEQKLIGPNKTPMAPDMCRFMARYWNSTRQGVSGHCPKCTKAARDAAFPRS